MTLKFENTNLTPILINNIDIHKIVVSNKIRFEKQMKNDLYAYFFRNEYI